MKNALLNSIMQSKSVQIALCVILVVITVLVIMFVVKSVKIVSPLISILMTAWSLFIKTLSSIMTSVIKFFKVNRDCTVFLLLFFGFLAISLGLMYRTFHYTKKIYDFQVLEIPVFIGD